MSLADQSQQWFPTSVRVTVHQAKDLRVKGKNGTNDAYAIIQVAKDKFSTCVAEKCVAPVWKEEASFDLPLFHPGNAERCTLYIIVMHRAQVGLDKFLGQAVVNLLEQHDNKAHKSTNWFKLVDKTGKEDKARGEVLLDIQFLRNNMSASMLDLSMQDKPRSRISKLKDKVRGKKKDGFSDSASAIVPSVSQVLTDSEGEADAVSLNQTPEEKKKSKIKTLFAPKSNLQRNISQSMSTLGTLPEKNSSLSSSRSSGLNVDSPGVKKKFKFLGHKRTGSSDSRVSQGPFSILGRSKQNDLNNLCINGSHVYSEEAEAKSGSTISLNSSGQGSVEDISKQTLDLPADTFKSAPMHSNSQSTDWALLEQQRHQEEQRRIAEAKRLEEEEKKRAEALILQQEEERRHQEEQNGKRRLLEDEARRKKQKEEEEMWRKQEEERRMLEAAENEKREEERRQEELRRQEQALKAEEQKRQEEASMSERLTSLFGMIRKKEEKKEDVAQEVKEEPPSPAVRQTRDQDLPASHKSTNPFEEISLSSDLAVSSNESPTESKPSSNPSIPSAMVFLNRTAKVSAVKPRLTLSDTLKSDPTDCQTSSQQCPSPAAPDSTLSIAPSESFDSFHKLHSSLAPQNRSLSNSPCGSTENLPSLEDSDTMAEKKRRAPLPPSYGVNGTHTGGREIHNPAYVEPDAPQQSQRMSLPLPDYDTLFPQKRHGVQGHTRWDHIIAEVNQKHRDSHVEFSGKEMSVDGPEERETSLPRESSTPQQYQTPPQLPKPVSSKNVAAPDPPKPRAPPQLRSQDESSQKQRQNNSQTRSSNESSDPSPSQRQVSTDRTSVESVTPSDGPRKVLRPPTTALQPPTPKSQTDPDKSPQGNQSNTQTSANKDAPTAKPRQRVSGKEPALQEDSVKAPDRNTVSDSNVNIRERKENFAQFDPFPNNELLSKDPWGQTKHNQDVDNLFTGNLQKEKKPEEQGMTADDLDNIFSSKKTTDPFTVLNGADSDEDTEDMNKSLTPQHQIDLKIQNPFMPSSSLMVSSEPLPVVMEEPAAGGLAAGKTPLRAWVSPSEVQPVSAQNSSGGGLALSQRRPHPVKPLNPADSQQPTSAPAFKEKIKVHDSAPAKNKVSGSSKSGPYTQLTQEELITLVVKQQADLSKKDAKIVELEEYIDNLLVRVIEEKPTILHALNAAKPV